MGASNVWNRTDKLRGSQETRPQRSSCAGSYKIKRPPSDTYKELWRQFSINFFLSLFLILSIPSSYIVSYFTARYSFFGLDTFVDWAARVCFYGCCDGVSSILCESIGPGCCCCCCDGRSIVACWPVRLQHDVLNRPPLGLVVGWCWLDDVQSTIHNDGTGALMNCGLTAAEPDESIGEEPELVSLNLAVICFFHFVRRFWNHVLIWTSVSERFFDNSIRLLTLKYLSTCLIKYYYSCCSYIGYIYIYTRCGIIMWRETTAI